MDEKTKSKLINLGIIVAIVIATYLLVPRWAWVLIVLSLILIWIGIVFAVLLGRISFDDILTLFENLFKKKN